MEKLEEKFGSQFEIDTRNRLDAVNPDREEVITDKSYMRLMYDVRLRLKKALVKEAPDFPGNVNNIDELFAEAEKTVHQNWSQYVSGLFDEHREKWLSKIDPTNPEYKELREILSNKEAFETKLRLFQLAPMEPLRSLFPEEWYKLIIAASERQLAQISLLNSWVKNSNGRLAEKMGMTDDELKLIIEMGGTFGKYFNMAFLKQIELADTPGGSSPTPLGNKPGVSRIYDVYKVDGDDFEIKTYGEIFNFEWSKITDRMNRLSEKTDKLVKENRLPESYKNLPAYLNLLAETYGSEEKDPDKLKEKWDKLDKACEKLADSGCPLTIIGQAFPGLTGESRKVDIELRIGYRNKEAESFEKKLESFRGGAQEVVDSKKSAVSKSVSVPKPKVSRQLFAFGSNLVWETLADTRVETTNVHYNTIAKEGTAIKGVVDTLFAENKIDDKRYKDSFVIDTNLHEMGHGILPVEDPDIVERVGKTNEAAILEELKAEAASFVILQNYMAGGKDADIEGQVLTKIAVLLSYVLNASPEEGSANERYYYTGVIILNELMDKGVLQKKGGTYSVGDPKQAVEVIASMGNGIIKEYYENKNSNPKIVEQKFKELRRLKDKPEIAELIKSAREAQAK